MQNRFQAKTLATLAAVTLAGTALTACSTESEDAAEGSGIIATTGVWADVAAAVTGEDVDAIITGDAVDPHHFEPSAKDLSRIKEAATVVANGGAYDAALYTVAEQDRIVHAFRCSTTQSTITSTPTAITCRSPSTSWSTPGSHRQRSAR